MLGCNAAGTAEWHGHGHGHDTTGQGLTGRRTTTLEMIGYSGNNENTVGEYTEARDCPNTGKAQRNGIQ
jgi:hypothetical protein